MGVGDDDIHADGAYIGNCGGQCGRQTHKFTDTAYAGYGNCVCATTGKYPDWFIEWMNTVYLSGEE